MKIYRVKWTSPSYGTCLQWGGSLKDVACIKRKVKAGEMLDYDSMGIDVDLVDIPTDKGGLIWWLNTYLNKDNG